MKRLSDNNKILILGAGIYQLPLIKKARQMGLYVISADNCLKNPGHKFSSQALEIDTRDKDRMLAFAIKKDINAVLTIASDLALPTVAYIAEKMKLPGLKYGQTLIVTNKSKFRGFQKNNKFLHPTHFVVNSEIEGEELCENLKGTFICKPVDRSGSIGVSILHLPNDLEKFVYKKVIKRSFSYSFAKQIIIEEYINGNDYSCEGFIDKDKFFLCAITKKHTTGEPFYISTHHIIPSGLSIPTQKQIIEIVKKMLSLLDVGISPFNFDLKIDNKGNIYVIEMTLRNGGNCLPELVKEAYGIDLLYTNVNASLGRSFDKGEYFIPNKAVGVKIFLTKHTGSTNIPQFNRNSLSEYNKNIIDITFDNDTNHRTSVEANQRVGHIIVSGPNAENVESILNRIESSV